MSTRKFQFRLRTILLWVACASALLATSKGFYDWVIGPVVPHSLTDQLVLGMTMSEVELLLGKPTTKDGADWIYERTGNPGWLVVLFDRHGRLVSIDNEYAGR